MLHEWRGEENKVSRGAGVWGRRGLGSVEASRRGAGVDGKAAGAGAAQARDVAAQRTLTCTHFAEPLFEHVKLQKFVVKCTKR
jgi:hypothetical protein